MPTPFPKREFCAYGRGRVCSDADYPRAQGGECKAFRCTRCEQLVGYCRGHAGDVECSLCDDCCMETGMPCVTSDPEPEAASGEKPAETAV